MNPGTKMLKRICYGLFFTLALLVLSSGTIYAAEPLEFFNSEDQAQQHCPSDVVVWLNIPSGVYHFKGERWYGATKNGAYVCKSEADQAGDRATRNGQ